MDFFGSVLFVVVVAYGVFSLWFLGSSYARCRINEGFSRLSWWREPLAHVGFCVGMFFFGPLFLFGLKVGKRTGWF